MDEHLDERDSRIGGPTRPRASAPTTSRLRAPFRKSYETLAQRGKRRGTIAWGRKKRGTGPLIKALVHITRGITRERWRASLYAVPQARGSIRASTRHMVGGGVFVVEGLG